MLNIKDGFGSDTNLATEFDSETNEHIPLNKDADRTDLNDRLGSKNEAAPVTDTSPSGLNGRLQRIAQRLGSLVSVLPLSLGQKVSAESLPVTISSDQSSIQTTPSNIVGKFREAFEVYTPNTVWQEEKASGDYIYLDGNAVGASYLVISKDPFSDGVSSITTNLESTMPLDLAIGLHTSQRTLGQEFSIEVISTEEPQAPPSDIAISSISQSTTTLTVNTAVAHNLKPGTRIGIYGVNDSRFNYPSLVVATIPTPTQFTVTAGPMGTIPSVTAGPFTTGFVYIRSATGYAINGTSMILEQASNTQASFYIKSVGGDPHVAGGTLNGSHSVTISNTSSLQSINAPYTYAFSPITEYRLSLMADKVQWHDVGIDALGATTNRATRTQVVPDSTKNYKLRIRATNNKGLTRPIAKILTVTKSGSTTATVVTDVPHGLTVTDQIVTYGVRDQTNFANLTTATTVASIISPTSFTIVWGSSATVSSTGGYIARVNGSNLMSSLGAITQVISTAALSNGILTLVGSASWSGLLIGDTVNVIGCTNTSTNTLTGVDGAWKVRNISTTTLELEPLPGFNPPSDFTVINCGGAIVKRTDLRLSFVRIFDFERQRVESLPRPSGDESSSFPVRVHNTVSVSAAGSTQNIGYVGLQLPLLVADVTSAALTSTTTTSAVTPTFGCSYQVNVPVTAVTGTNPTLDIVIQESDDTGTNWYNVYSFPRITAVGIYRSPIIPLTGNRIRYVQTVGGSSPSFTRSINRLQSSHPGSATRQLFDRTITLTTLNSVTQTLSVADCANLQLAINIGAATTPPQLQLEGSDDNGLTWYLIGSPLAAVANSTTNLFVPSVNSQLVRARVSTAGATVTAGYVLLKGWGD